MFNAFWTEKKLIFRTVSNQLKRSIISNNSKEYKVTLCLFCRKVECSLGIFIRCRTPAKIESRSLKVRSWISDVVPGESIASETIYVPLNNSTLALSLNLAFTNLFHVQCHFIGVCSWFILSLQSIVADVTFI